MDMEDTFSIKGSFQIIPEHRYEVTDDFLNSIRQRGFEVVVHDLNHDGQLFRDKDQFHSSEPKKSILTRNDLAPPDFGLRFSTEGNYGSTP